MKKALSALIIPTLCLGCALCSCAPAESEANDQFFAMETIMTNKAFGSNAQAALDEINAKAKKTIQSSLTEITAKDGITQENI